MKKSIFWIIVLFACISVNAAAQHSTPDSAFVRVSHRCGIHDLTPEKRKIQAQAYGAWLLNRQGAGTGPIQSEFSGKTYTIPVVVHIFEKVQGSTHTNVPAAIAALNRAFDGTVGVDTNIQFCLAQRAPDGGITNGVNRIASGYSNFDMDLEDAKLKTQLQWDPRHYLNIWVVDNIYSEIRATFTGRGGWRRTGAGGYATLPGGPVGLGAASDGIVVQGLGAGLLAHEIGHYLGLLHTFQGGCRNNDCTTDGDMVCDTPPDDESEGGCGGNSCKTDTLSNYSNGFFPVDVPDMTSNFMDYSSCGTEFTMGQVSRMHFHLDNYRATLDANLNNACTKPCNGSVLIDYFTPSDTIIATGNPVTFASTSSGATQYEWYIERLGDISSGYSVAMERGYSPSGSPVANTADLSHTFATEGKYRVYLKAWDAANPSCFASYSQVVRVTCDGVDARFWPNKRFIASKQSAGKFLDNVRFENLSAGATSYLWTVSHTPPDPLTGSKLPDFTSTDEHLDYVFPEPGTYAISLEAFNGACSDQAGPFSLTVVDPTMNGRPRILRADCLNEDSIKVRLRIFNTGYDTVNIDTPVSFYDENPRNASPTPKLLTTFRLTDAVYGYDSPRDFDVKMKGSRLKLDQLWVVFNDSGSTSFPITFVNGDRNVTSDRSQFPPSGWNELTYGDNYASKRDFQFKLLLAPLQDTICAYSDYAILAETRNDAGRTTAQWLPGSNLSCDDCLDPILSIQDQQLSRKLIVTSACGCTDSATVVIGPFPYDPPAITPPPEICQYHIAPDLSNYVAGQSITWYNRQIGGTGSAQAPVINGDVAGVYSFWVTQTQNGCEGPRAQVSLTVKPAPPPVVQVVPDVCQGADPPDVLATVTGTDVLWYTTASGGVGDLSPPSIDTQVPGTFSLWVTQTTNTCESPRMELTYTVVDLPPPPVIADTVHVCLGDAVPNLNNYVTGQQLKWYNDPAVDLGNTNPPVFDTSQPDTFSYFVTQTVNGCEGPSTEVFVQVNLLEVTGQDSYEIDEGESVDLSLDILTAPNEQEAVSVIWRDDEGNEVGNTAISTQTPPRSTTYIAEVTTAQGCRYYLGVYVEVIMKLRPAQIFTPNGDGRNEAWNVGFLEQFPDAMVTVYNRWGSPVFQRQGYQNDWRGDHNGSPLPVGTYYYVIDLASYERKAVTGSLTLMR